MNIWEDLKTSDTARDCVQSQATKFKADFNLLFVDEDNRFSINISVFKHSLPRAVNSRSIFMDHFWHCFKHSAAWFFLLRASTINISSCKTAVLCKITPKISTTLNFSGTWAMLFSIIFTRLMVHLYARLHNQLCSFSYFLMPSPCPRKYLQVHTFVIEGILLKYENTISEMWEQNLGSTLTFFSTYVHSDEIVRKSNSIVWKFENKALKLSTIQKLQYCKIQSII